MNGDRENGRRIAFGARLKEMSSWKYSSGWMSQDSTRTKSVGYVLSRVLS